MTVFTYEFNFKNAHFILFGLKYVAKKMNGKVIGNYFGGTFAFKFTPLGSPSSFNLEGTYKIAISILTLSVENFPFNVPERFLYDAMDNFFNEAIDNLPKKPDDPFTPFTDRRDSGPGFTRGDGGTTGHDVGNDDSGTPTPRPSGPSPPDNI